MTAPGEDHLFRGSTTLTYEPRSPDPGPSPGAGRRSSHAPLPSARRLAAGIGALAAWRCYGEITRGVIERLAREPSAKEHVEEHVEGRVEREAAGRGRGGKADIGPGWHDVGDERATIPTAANRQVTRLGQGRDCVAHGVPRNLEHRREFPFGWKLFARVDEPQPNGLQDSFDRLFEGVSTANGLQEQRSVERDRRPERLILREVGIHGG
jgi:hypothetical protein